MNDIKTKQQIVEKIKSSTNILVTVSNDPSVDALSAAIGLTIMLNKLNKHATAVFSGAVPPAITFLDPEKTFESTTDSLRDFIIALDKEKADHLRYKVEGDAVKIFITPYRKTITNEDLNFSQGDFNVELVLALGVDSQEHLDGALDAHGRILHDATIVTLSAGDQISKLGSIDWHEEQASGLCEMLVGLGDAFKADKPLLDPQIATALLTGVVAATDSFSNTHTSSKVMNVAAQLMAAGADQQLIAAKLQEAHEIGQLLPVENIGSNLSAVSEVASEKIGSTATAQSENNNGGLTIDHEHGKTLEDIANEVKNQNQEEAVDAAEQVLAERVEAIIPPPAPIVVPETVKPLRGAIDYYPSTYGEPSLGGTLNATTEQAEEDSQRELLDDQNKTILKHSYLSKTPTYSAPINGAAQPSDESADVDIFTNNSPASTIGQSVATQNNIANGMMSSTDITPSEPDGQTLAELDIENRGNLGDNVQHDEALAAVRATFDNKPTEQTAPILDTPYHTSPPLPDFSAPISSSISPAYALDQNLSNEQMGDIAAPGQISPSIQIAPVNNDPGQFKIPG